LIFSMRYLHPRIVLEYSNATDWSTPNNPRREGPLDWSTPVRIPCA
jgi:hypothetical protein